MDNSIASTIAIDSQNFQVILHTKPQRKTSHFHYYPYIPTLEKTDLVIRYDCQRMKQLAEPEKELREFLAQAVEYSKHSEQINSLKVLLLSDIRNKSAWEQLAKHFISTSRSGYTTCCLALLWIDPDFSFYRIELSMIQILSGFSELAAPHVEYLRKQGLRNDCMWLGHLTALRGSAPFELDMTLMPTSSHLIFEVGCLLKTKGQTNIAREVLRRLSLFPEGKNYCYHCIAREAGVMLLNENDYHNAAQNLTLATELLKDTEEEDPTLYYHAALALRKANRLEEAEEMIATYRRLEPNNYAGIQQEYGIKYALKKTKEALTIVEAGLLLFPNNLALLHDKITLLLIERRSAEAEVAVELAYSIDPNHTFTKLQKARVLFSGSEFGAALAICGTVLPALENKERIDCLVLMIRCCIQMGNFEQAKRMFREVRGDAYAQLLHLMLCEENFKIMPYHEELIPMFQELVLKIESSKRMNYYTSLFKLAEAYFKRHQHIDRFIEILLVERSKHKDLTFVHYYLALAYLDVKNYVDAIKYARIVIQAVDRLFNPADIGQKATAHIKRGLGIALFRSNQLEEAYSKLFDAYLQNDQDSLVVLMLLESMLKLKRDLPQAINIAKTALKNLTAKTSVERLLSQLVEAAVAERRLLNEKPKKKEEPKKPAAAEDTIAEITPCPVEVAVSTPSSPDFALDSLADGAIVFEPVETALPPPANSVASPSTPNREETRPFLEEVAAAPAEASASLVSLLMHDAAQGSMEQALGSPVAAGISAETPKIETTTTASAAPAEGTPSGLAPVNLLTANTASAPATAASKEPSPPSSPKSTVEEIPVDFDLKAYRRRFDMEMEQRVSRTDAVLGIKSNSKYREKGEGEPFISFKEEFRRKYGPFDRYQREPTPPLLKAAPKEASPKNARSKPAAVSFDKPIRKEEKPLKMQEGLEKPLPSQPAVEAKATPAAPLELPVKTQSHAEPIVLETPLPSQPVEAKIAPIPNKTQNYVDRLIEKIQQLSQSEPYIALNIPIEGYEDFVMRLNQFQLLEISRLFLSDSTQNVSVHLTALVDKQVVGRAALSKLQSSLLYFGECLTPDQMMHLSNQFVKAAEWLRKYLLEDNHEHSDLPFCLQLGEYQTRELNAFAQDNRIGRAMKLMEICRREVLYLHQYRHVVTAGQFTQDRSMQTVFKMAIIKLGVCFKRIEEELFAAIQQTHLKQLMEASQDMLQQMLFDNHQGNPNLSDPLYLWSILSHFDVYQTAFGILTMKLIGVVEEYRTCIETRGELQRLVQNCLDPTADSASQLSEKKIVKNSLIKVLNAYYAVYQPGESLTMSVENQELIARVNRCMDFQTPLAM